MTARDVSGWLPNLLGPVEIQADGDAVTARGTWNFIGFALSDVAGVLTFTSLAVVGGTELPLVLGEETTTSTIATRKGARNIDLSFWPAVAGALTRQIKLAVTLDCSDAAATATVDLYDQTNSVVVTDSELDNSAAGSKVTPTEFVSAALTVGEDAGDLRTDAVSMYLLRLRRVGGTGAHAVTCTNARLVVDYVV